MTPAFARNIKALRTSNGLTQAQLADAIGSTRQTVGRWESGKIAIPRNAEVIKSLTKLFGVDETDLFGTSDGFYAKKYGLSEAPQGALAANPDPRPAYAPLYGRVHAGGAQEPDILDDRIPIPFEVREAHPKGYFLEVEGTCMDRVYPEGCHVYVDPDREPQNGSIAVVSIDGADYVMRKLLRGAHTLVLSPQSYDTKWEDIVVSEGDGHTVAMVGTVVWYQAEREME